jgi:cysteine-rich repeat protein
MCGSGTIRALASSEALPVMHLRRFLLAVLTASLAAAAPAGAILANTPNDLCPGLPDPCVVGHGLYEVVGAQRTFDFGSRTVVFQQGAKLQANSGATVSLLLGNLTLDPGAALVAPGGTINVSATGDVDLMRDGNRARARIDVNEAISPGLITITAGGAVVIDGNLEAIGRNNEGGTGAIDVLGESVTASGDLLTRGGILGDGGSIGVQSSNGAVLLSGLLDAAGGFGGVIGIDAVGGGVTTTTGNQASKLDIRATGSGGDGGVVEISATGDVSLAAPVLGRGSDAGSEDFGGLGGEVVITSDRSIVIGTQATIDLPGAVPEGDGGEVSLVAGLDIVQRGRVIAFGRATFGGGGLFEALAERDLTVGDVDVYCDNCNGGEVIAETWCHLEVPDDAFLDAKGTNGSIQLVTGGTMTVDGRLRSTANSLEHLTGTPAPDTAGGTFEPAPTVTQNPTLTPCGGIPSPGCGNDMIDEGEQCDDGNTMPCDGCSSTCQIETCGNGVVDCDEVCDDGNTDACEGDCAADCLSFHPVCGNGVVECAEQDDDGNLTDCDGVSSSCMIEECGNGIRECTEECDDANDPDCNVDLCRLEPVNCGNGTLDPGEACDDGNTADCDGCSHLCTDEGCGNGIVETCPAGSSVPSEECDDFNTDCNDGCSPQCRFEVCGNGIRDCDEPCDEGAQNGQPGSSCLTLDDGQGNLTCVEGELCTSESEGPCIPCATTAECDPLNRCGLAACQAGVCVPVDPPDCDDDDACTADSCNPASGCANRNTCNDADACTDDACDPATGCSHTRVVCDDGDLCTDETCDPIAGCLRTERQGFAAVACRTDTLEALLAAATDAELHEKARKKLGAFLRKIRAKLAAAESGVSSGRSRKVTRAMKGANTQVDKLGAFVIKQRGRQVGETLAAALLEAIDDLDGRAQTLAGSLAT